MIRPSTTNDESDMKTYLTYLTKTVGDMTIVYYKHPTMGDCHVEYYFN